MARPKRMPGDRPDPVEEQAAQSSTLEQIKAELDAEREADAARDRALSAQLATGNHSIKLAPTETTPEQRAAAHAETVAMIKAEMAAQAAETGVTFGRVPPQGLDQASIDLIKAEIAKNNRRVVLASG